MPITGILIKSILSVHDLDALPSSFPSYITLTRSQANLSITDYDLLKVIKNVNQNYLARNYQQVISDLEEILEFATKQNCFTNNPPKLIKDFANPRVEAGLFRTLSFAYAAQKDLDKALKYMELSADCHIRGGNFREAEDSYKHISHFHQLQGSLANYQKACIKGLQKANNQQSKLKFHFALASIAQQNGDRRSEIKHFNEAFLLQQGRIDYDARRVEQREVCFSAGEKLGTDNIQQCVAVIIHDPITKKTALAHVDRYTAISSLSKVVKAMPKVPLDVYLVGGRDKSNISYFNIDKVIRELYKHDHLILRSADIGGKGSPSAIVFDPQSAKLSHAVPGKVEVNTPIRIARVEYSSNPKGEERLNLGFDSINGKPYIPVMDTIDNPGKEFIVNRGLAGLMQATVQKNSSACWKASLLDNPAIKATELIIKEQPDLALKALHDCSKKYITEIVDRKLYGTKYDEVKKEELIGQLQKNLATHMAQGNISIFDSKKFVEEIVNKSIDSSFKNRMLSAKAWPGLIREVILQQKKYYNINTNKIDELTKEFIIKTIKIPLIANQKPSVVDMAMPKAAPQQPNNVDNPTKSPNAIQNSTNITVDDNNANKVDPKQQKLLDKLPQGDKDKIISGLQKLNQKSMNKHEGAPLSLPAKKISGNQIAQKK